MKLEIPESQLADVNRAIEAVTTTAESLRVTQSRVDQLITEREKSNAKVDELSGVVLPTDKQVLELLVSRERRSIIDGATAEFSQFLAGHKQSTTRAISDGNEIFRRAAGEQLTEDVKRQLLESLPPSVRSNDHLLVSVWNGSDENRTLGLFLNAPIPSRRDGSDTILAAAERTVRLLRDLLEGNDISVPGIENVPAATDA